MQTPKVLSQENNPRGERAMMVKHCYALNGLQMSRQNTSDREKKSG